MNSDFVWVFWVVAIGAGYLAWNGEERGVGRSVGVGLVAGWVAFYAVGSLADS